jgi:pimeloyl-ACP methyl ester carboxylesterase
MLGAAHSGEADLSSIDLPGGARIWYQCQGGGAPLLHIHGSAFGHRNFEKLTPLAAQYAQVIDFDLPGYGESRSDPMPVGMPAMAELIFEFVQTLGLSRINVHGTSFGAMLGLTLAARHPEMVNRLVLSCFLARYDLAARLMRATWKRAARDSGMRAVADLTSVAGFARGFYQRAEAEEQLESMREAFARTTPEAFIASTEMIEQADLGAVAATVAAPTLLLGGEEDNTTPIHPAPGGVGFSTIRHLLSHCELEILPDCGHYLVLEQPAVAAALIERFLAADA